MRPEHRVECLRIARAHCVTRMDERSHMKAMLKEGVDDLSGSKEGACSRRDICNMVPSSCDVRDRHVRELLNDCTHLSCDQCKILTSRTCIFHYQGQPFILVHCMSVGSHSIYIWFDMFQIALELPALSTKI